MTTFSSSERQAPYLVDGLLHNDVVEFSIHSTDTHGFTEVNFALTALLGIEFAPRIQSFQDQQFYAFVAMDVPDLAADGLAPACEVVVDAAYASDGRRGWIAAEGALAVIPPNPRRKHLPHLTRSRRPNAITLSRPSISLSSIGFKQYRRLATRYDKLDASFEAFVCARIITLYLN